MYRILTASVEDRAPFAKRRHPVYSETRIGWRGAQIRSGLGHHQE